MWVDVSGVRAARLEDVDPEAVEAKLSGAEVEVRGVGKGANLLVQPALELADGGVPGRQIGQ